MPPRARSTYSCGPSSHTQGDGVLRCLDWAASSIATDAPAPTTAWAQAQRGLPLNEQVGDALAAGPSPLPPRYSPSTGAEISWLDEPAFRPCRLAADLTEREEVRSTPSGADSWYSRGGSGAFTVRRPRASHCGDPSRQVATQALLISGRAVLVEPLWAFRT